MEGPSTSGCPQGRPRLTIPCRCPVCHRWHQMSGRCKPQPGSASGDGGKYSKDTSRHQLVLGVMQLYTYKYTHICIYVCVCVYVYIYVCVCTHHAPLFTVKSQCWLAKSPSGAPLRRKGPSWHTAGPAPPATDDFPQRWRFRFFSHYELRFGTSLRWVKKCDMLWCPLNSMYKYEFIYWDHPKFLEEKQQIC